MKNLTLCLVVLFCVVSSTFAGDWRRHSRDSRDLDDYHYGRHGRGYGWTDVGGCYHPREERKRGRGYGRKRDWYGGKRHRGDYGGRWHGSKYDTEVTEMEPGSTTAAPATPQTTARATARTTPRLTTAPPKTTVAPSTVQPMPVAQSYNEDMPETNPETPEAAKPEASTPEMEMPSDTVAPVEPTVTGEPEPAPEPTDDSMM